MTLAVAAEAPVVEAPPSAPESPLVQVWRNRLNKLHKIFSILGQATIRAQECKAAAEILDFLQGDIDTAEGEVQRLLSDEHKLGLSPAEHIANAMSAPVVPSKAS